MIVHFHEQVIALRKIEDQARTMIVTDRGECNIQYHHSIRNYLIEEKSLSGNCHLFRRARILQIESHRSFANGFPSSKIEDKIKENP
jgi:type I restriction enzyme R subunit